MTRLKESRFVVKEKGRGLCLSSFLSIPGVESRVLRQKESKGLPAPAYRPRLTCRLGSENRLRRRITEGARGGGLVPPSKPHGVRPKGRGSTGGHEEWRGHQPALNDL